MKTVHRAPPCELMRGARAAQGCGEGGKAAEARWNIITCVSRGSSETEREDRRREGNVGVGEGGDESMGPGYNGGRLVCVCPRTSVCRARESRCRTQEEGAGERALNTYGRHGARGQVPPEVVL